VDGERVYLVLVIGAQPIPGLWVVLSVPAAEGEEVLCLLSGNQDSRAREARDQRSSQGL
jgi:hypothetical protein